MKNNLNLIKYLARSSTSSFLFLAKDILFFKNLIFLKKIEKHSIISLIRRAYEYR